MNAGAGDSLLREVTTGLRYCLLFAQQASLLSESRLAGQTRMRRRRTGLGF